MALNHMRVEQAIYGEVQGRGHGLRIASTDMPIVSELALKLDLPDAAPPGVSWSPFVRGFPLGGYYILARTFLDTTATRSGMVLSHALIVRLDEICELVDISELFESLTPSLEDLPGVVQSLELSIAEKPYSRAAELTGAANAFAERSAGPLIRLGVAGFEALVAGIWRNFWPALRRTFAFRLSFGPNDLVEPLPTIVCSPEQLLARWTKHRILAPDDLKPTSEAASILCGQRDARPLLEFAAQLGFEISAVKELPRLERAHYLLESGRGFDDLLAASRLVGGLSGDPARGITRKTALVHELAEEISQVTCQQLLTMRNLDLSGFKDSSALWSAVEQRVSRLDFLPPNDDVIHEMLTTVVDVDAARLAWRRAFAAGFVAAASKGGAVLPSIWRMTEYSMPAFKAALSILPTDSALEKGLAEAVPTKLNVRSPDDLLKVVLSKQWLAAHGALLSATHAALEAARIQLKVEKSGLSDVGLRLALRNASAAQLLECAKTLKDQRLVTLAAEAVVSKPTVLAGIKCEDLTEQLVWSASLKKSPALWNAPRDAIAARDIVLAQLMNREQIDISLIEALSTTPLANLTGLSERSRVWHVLPSTCRDAYLHATATGWIQAAVKGEGATSPEHPLEQFIVNILMSLTVSYGVSLPLESGLTIIGALPSFPEDRFLSWVHSALAFHRRLSPAGAEQLGVLVARRKWERTAKELADRYASSRHDLQPALRACADLVGLVRCWLLGISKPTTTEKWAAFEEEACELYPDGPDTGELWSRAGGKNSALPPKTSNGQARWHTALLSIRHGGKPSARELLAVMSKDFDSNEKIRLYASDSDIVGSYWRYEIPTRHTS